MNTFDFETVRPAEKAVLAGLLVPQQDEALFTADMEEMRLLCTTAGALVTDTIVQKREKIVASTYLGRGKLDQIKSLMRQQGCTTLVIDADLSPGQMNNIEKAVKGKVVDRSQLILDIFAQHARTMESRIQVELAQMRTLYPRLTHAWTHFSQQVGGIGTRGPGEKQLEVDRRLVQKRIADLTDRLKKINRGRATRRKGRRSVKKIALVGYTNAGKSSILNALCGANALVEDKLFATLDTTTRKLFLEDAPPVVVTDTVGFLRKLPHHLVASFRSTLDVVTDADLLGIVLDGASPWISQHYATVLNVLDDLDAGTVPRLAIINKMDLVRNSFERKRLELAWPDAVCVSARNMDSMQVLRHKLADTLTNRDHAPHLEEAIARKLESEHSEPLIPPHRYVD